MNYENDPNEFLGRGLKFPFKINSSTGKIDMVSGIEAIEQSIHTILSTKPGERFFHSDFGIDLSELQFEPMDETTLKEIETRIMDGLSMHQTMIIPESVDFELDINGGRILIDVKFLIRSTNTRGNYVFPYYLKEANQF